jgi:hypothetical protein
MSEVYFGCDEYTVSAGVGALPAIYPDCVKRAVLHEDFGVHSPDETALFFAVSRGSRAWPSLVVAMRFDPGPEAGFNPGFLLIPENHLLFVGAGTSLLAYGLAPVRRLWKDTAEMGFWGWRRHGDAVLMAVELEFAAWDTKGRKLWSTFVEPPWSYEIGGNMVELDVMGAKSSFGVLEGRGDPARSL